MASPPTHSIPARTGKAVALPKDHTIRITNTHGTQVVDFWAFTYVQDQLSAFLSLAHTRASTLRLWPRVSDTLVTNRREAILEFTADTSLGVHDTLLAACDPARYRGLGFAEADEHASCAQNLRAALSERGIAWPSESPLLEHWTPAPFNLFMNIPVGEGNALSFEPPASKAGDYVELKALVEDVMVVMSCCPQDRVPINGKDCVPKGVKYMVIAP